MAFSTLIFNKSNLLTQGQNYPKYVKIKWKFNQCQIVKYEWPRLEPPVKISYSITSASNKIQKRNLFNSDSQHKTNYLVSFLRRLFSFYKPQNFRLSKANRSTHSQQKNLLLYLNHFNVSSQCVNRISRIEKPLAVRHYSKTSSFTSKSKDQPTLLSTSKKLNTLFKHFASVPPSKHGYSDSVEKLVNEQINEEFSAGYCYLNIATYYGRSDVALPGFHGFFMKMFYEEIGHGIGLIKFQNMRGGIVKWTPLGTLDSNEWCDLSETFLTALTMEKNIKEVLFFVLMKSYNI